MKNKNTINFDLKHTDDLMNCLKLSANIRQSKHHIATLEEDIVQLNILNFTMNRLQINNFTIKNAYNKDMQIILINQIKFPAISQYNNLKGPYFQKIAFENKIKLEDI